MKNTGLVLIMMLVYAVASAQEVRDDIDDRTRKFADRYSLLVSKLGPGGVGIETVLDGWAEADSSDVRMLTARFNYYFTKSQRTEVVTRPVKKYLGMEPVLQLKDSTGKDVYYFQEVFYDDSLYAKAARSVDRAIRLYPDRLDLRFLKAAALVAYEKDSPDMALAYLESLVDEDHKRAEPWVYPGIEMDAGFFSNAMQEYCYTFFNIATAGAYKAFLSLSEKMLSYEPANTVFLANVGSYYLVAESDYKTALKYYNKVLKIKPDDYTAIKNCVLLSRKQDNVKLEKKYLPLLVEYGTDAERLSAKARLDALSKK